jgi:quinol monooxygenase YgiN
VTSEHKEVGVVIEYIRYEIPVGQCEQFINAYRAAAEQLASARQCLAFEVSRGIESPGRFVVRIEWTSKHAHEVGFQQEGLFRAFQENVRPFNRTVQEMDHYQVEVVSVPQPA